MGRISLVSLQVICGAFLLVAPFHATAAESAVESTTAIPTSEGTITAGSRQAHANHAEPQEIQDEIQAEVEESQTMLLQNEGKQATTLVSPKKGSVNAFTSYTMTHLSAFHNPLSIVFDAMTLEDGSTWVIHPDDIWTTFKWLPTDLVVVTSNFWSNVYGYIITNQNTNESVKVRLLSGNTIYGNQVVLVDYLLDYVWLDDGSCWKITDCTIAKQWVVGDVVVIGVNDGLFSGSYPNLLINVNMLNHSRASYVY